MVSHSRLQNYDKHYAMGCLTGSLGCRWHRYQQSTERAKLCDLFWFWFLVVVSAFILFWFYYWILSENSLADLNWYAYHNLGVAFPAYTILFALTCTTLGYIFILDVLALCHVGLGQQLYIHWVHRIVLVIILVLCVVATIFLDSLWKDGWQLQKISLMITSPFLHVSAVVLMTFLTWFIAGWILDGNFAHCQSQASNTALRICCFGLYLLIMIGLFICPIFIRSPCISAHDELPTKPLLVAHKGASALAPENTLAAFKIATDYDVLVLESDVSISYDGVPFILHDDDLRRTTNVDEVFPDKKSMAACWFNMSQLRQLDAGSWFIENKPFPGSPSSTESEKTLFRNQTIPDLVELLQVAMRANTSVMFDIKFYDSADKCSGHPYMDDFGRLIVDTITNSSFPSDKMWWLYYDQLNISTDYTKVENDKSISPKTLRENGVTHVNFGFSDIFWDQIEAYNAENISVNMYVIDSPWLYSLYWCMGVSSVTTNKCSLFYGVSRPVWHLTPEEFLALWLTTDLVSIVIVIIIWFAQKFRRNTALYSMESMSVHSSHTKITHPPHTMKEKLLFTNEHFQEPDIALTEVEVPQATQSSSSGSPSTDNEAFDPSANNVTARVSTADTLHTDVVTVSVGVDDSGMNVDQTVNSGTDSPDRANVASSEEDDRQRVNSATEMLQQ